MKVCARWLLAAALSVLSPAATADTARWPHAPRTPQWTWGEDERQRQNMSSVASLFLFQCVCVREKSEQLFRLQQTCDKRNEKMRLNFSKAGSIGRLTVQSLSYLRARRDHDKTTLRPTRWVCLYIWPCTCVCVFSKWTLQKFYKYCWIPHEPLFTGLHYWKKNVQQRFNLAVTVFIGL